MTRAAFLVAATIALSAELPSVDLAALVIEDLRAVAVKAGCPATLVRVGMRWLGEGHAVEVDVRCAPAPTAAPAPSDPEGAPR